MACAALNSALNSAYLFTHHTNWFPFLFRPPCRLSTDELRKCSMCCLTSTAEEQTWVDVELVSVSVMLFYEQRLDEYFTAHLFTMRP